MDSLEDRHTNTTETLLLFGQVVLHSDSAMADADDCQEAQETSGEGSRFLRNPPGAEASDGLQATQARSLEGPGREAP